MPKAITIPKFCIVFLLVAMAATWIQTCNPSFIMLANADSPDSSSDMSASSSNITVPAENFSVVWITDTQYLSESYPTYFDSLCRWIVNNANTYNVKMVVHTGDLVDTEGNLTQWANANDSMSVLLDAGMPYCWDAGNHDYNATCWIGNQFEAFNTSVMQQKPYWVADNVDGQNTAVHFSVSGWDCLIVNIEYNASDEVLTWANNILDAYPNSHAIVAAHFYVNRTGGYESWAANFQSKVLETHPNVFLTLSAHVYPLAYSGLRTQVGDRYELVFNRQDKDNELGAASLRILTFDVADGVVDVKTHVLYANDFLEDSNNKFTLDTTFHNDAAQNVPELPTGVSLVLVVLFASIVVVCVYKSRLRKVASVFLS
jgi:hypothetical protein